MLATLTDLASLALVRVAGSDARLSHDVARVAIPSVRASVREVLGAHSALAGQAHVLSRDPWHVLWSDGQRAFLPFHERTFSLIAWRDPIGPEPDASLLLEGFRRLAERSGKHAVVLAASSARERQLLRRGFQSVWVGSEPFFELATWSIRGKSGEKVRLACNHARRVGLSAREAFPLANDADRRAIAAVENDWKAARPARRMRSFLRTEPMENAAIRRYFVAEDASGRTVAFLVCSPVSARGFYLQDLVRHPEAPRGATELVSLHAIDTFRREGHAFATMGIVPFHDPELRRTGSRSSEIAARFVIGHFDRLFRFAGLRQFRSKFVASRNEDVYTAFWPRVLTPMVAWEIGALLS